MEDQIVHFFSEYAYQPYLIYSAIIGFMLLSAFGLPLPEEVVLISSGLVAYSALHPELYPPPYPNAPVVNVYILAFVAFFAVVISDYLIYFLGKKFGPKVFETKLFKKTLKDEHHEKIQAWVQKYGYFAVVIFRFTPGIRFPGHIMCGALGLRTSKYLLIDSTAALISAPTQVLLAAFYGKEIMHYLREFKIFVVGIILVSFIGFQIYKYLRKNQFLSKTAK